MPNKVDINVIVNGTLQDILKQSEEIKKNIDAINKGLDLKNVGTKQKELDELIKQYKNLDKSAKDIIKTEQLLNKSQKEYNDTLQKSKQVIKETDSELVKKNAVIKTLEASQKLLKKANEETSEKFINQALRIKELKSEYNALQKEQLAQNKAQKTINELSEKENLTLQDKRDLLTAYKKQISGITTDITKQTQAEKQLIQTTDALNTEVKQAEENYGDFQRSVGDYRNQIIKALTSMEKLKAEGKENTAEFKLLEKQVNETTNAYKSLTLQNEKIENQFKELTKTTKKTALGFKDVFGAVTLSGLAQRGVDLLIEGVKRFNEEINLTNQLQDKLRGTTGATGEELNDLTVKVKTLTSTFQDIDESTLSTALNTTVKEFGISTNEAFDLIEEGFLKGSNANGEFLEILKEYPTQFKSAGLNAQETFAIINQSVKEGIYSDKGADVIKESLIRLRELTPATELALKNIGFTSEEIQKGIEDGTLASFEGIQKVSTKLNELPENSQAVGTALADIFGGPGEDAGIRYIKMLSTVQTDLSGVEDSVSDLTKAELNFNKVISEITVSLASSEGGLASLKAEAFNLSAGFLDAIQNSESLRSLFNILKNTFGDLFTAIGQVTSTLSELGNTLGFASEEGSGFETIFKVLTTTTKLAYTPILILSKGLTLLANIFSEIVTVVNSAVQSIKEYVKENEFLSNIFTAIYDRIKLVVSEVVKLKDSLDAFFGDKEGLTALSNLEKGYKSLGSTVQETETQITETLVTEKAKQIDTLTDFVNQAFELEQLRINTIQDLKKKELTQNELDFNKLRNQYKDNAEALELIEIDFQQTKAEIVDSFKIEQLDPDLLEKTKDTKEKLIEEYRNMYNDINSIVEEKSLKDKFIESLGLNEDTINQIKETLGELFNAINEFNIQKNEIKLEEIEKERERLEEQTQLQLEALENQFQDQETNLQGERELWEQEQDNDYLRTLSIEANADARANALETERQRILENQKIADAELLKEQEKIQEKQKQLKKREIIAQLLSDTASSISSAVKNSQANPTNALTLNATAGIQFAIALGQITTSMLLARQSIKKLRKGAKITGKTHEQGGELFELERGETVVPANKTAQFENVTNSLLIPNSTPADVLKALERDAGIVNEFKENNSTYNYEIVGLKEQNNILSQQLKEKQTTNRLLNKILNKQETVTTFESGKRIEKTGRNVKIIKK